MVVIPTSDHVELHYGWTGLDLGAWAITFLAIAGIVWVARRRPVLLPEPPPPPPEEHVDPFVVDPSDVPEPAPTEVLSPSATP
jgi:hypothetical protein